MKIAIFTGSFNPFTIGHADIVNRALKMFDRVVIGIGYNPDKSSGDDMASRVRNISKVYADEDRVTVEAYSDLTVDFARRHDATCIIKGVRTVQDFEYERTQAEVNSLIGDGIETIFLFARPELASISSSIVRTLEYFGKDVSQFLPKDCSETK